MKVIHPSIYESRRRKEKNLRRRKSVPYFFVIIMLGIYGTYAMVRPLTPIKPEVHPVSYTTIKPDKPLNYPFSVSLYAEGLGTVTETNAVESRSTASTIKVLAATLILQKKPLKADEQGEMITFDEADAAMYREKLANGESVTAFDPGTSISQRDALEAVLIASANNVTEKLAVWAYGSVDNYLAAAKRFTEVKGLSKTTIADVSGFSKGTKSSAADMQVIVQEALKQPAIVSITSKAEVQVGDKTLVNTNKLLGVDGISGLKTGYTDEAGGCLLLTQDREIFGNKIRVSAVILGAPDKAATFTSGRTVIANIADFISNQNLVTKGSVLGWYEAPWGARSEIVATEALYDLAVDGQEVFARPTVDNIGPSVAGTVVGVISSGKQKVNLELKTDFAKPPLIWRLLHPTD